MPRFKLTIEYAGTRYSGWQIQKNARTIQGEIDRAVRAVTRRQDFELYGSGRTDAGVHAIGQVAHLDVSTSVPPDPLRARLNAELPADINILSAVVVPHRFHARHDAVARRYVYQIARRRSALFKPFVWWIKDSASDALDVPRMRRAADLLVGMKDFQSFADADGESKSKFDRDEPHGGARSTLVLVETLAIVEAGDLVLVGVEGSHFLWKMVRRIVGVLSEVGRGALEPDAVARFLVDRSDVPARLTAPASGLFLEKVYYEGDARLTDWTAPTPLAAASSRRRSAC